MASYLSLCQDVVRECGISGTLTTTVSQAGEFNRVVNWVKQAWIEIQNRHNNWLFMRHEASVDTTAGDGTYAASDFTDLTLSTAITNFSHWLVEDLEDPPKAYLTSTGIGGEYWVSYLDWHYFRTVYLSNQNRTTQGQPAHIAVDPRLNIRLGQLPNDIYTVTVNYYRSAQEFSLDADTPTGLPSQFHSIIMYRAMEKYAGYESAQEVMVRATSEGNRVLRQLEINQLPAWRLGEPLA